MQIVAANTLSNKKMVLERTIKAPMEVLAQQCATVCSTQLEISAVLHRSYSKIVNCHSLYVTDISGEQLSCTVTDKGINDTGYGLRHTKRPYFQGQLPYRGLVLSQAYIDKQNSQPRINALQAITHKDELVGFLVAEFQVRELSAGLPEIDINTGGLSHWLQYRGDPAIRSTVFTQQRISSPLDRNLRQLNQLLTQLICWHGVFHIKIHYSSSRCTIWSVKDPYNYHLHNLDEILDPEFFQYYPRCQYSRKAVVNKNRVAQVFQQFQQLREGDSTLYLRSASLNIINGLVGLTFSCDGTHYLGTEDFLAMNTGFWLGEKASA